MNGQQSFQHVGVIGGLLDFGFRRFITLSIVQVLYIIGFAVLFGAWLIMILFATWQADMELSVLVVVLGTPAVLLCAILFRVWLEFLVIIFRIAENTSRLVRQKTID